MKINTKNNWNKMADAYENFTGNPNSYSYLIEWPCIKELLPDLKNSEILDLGCGTGRFSFLFEDFNAKYILGVDNSEEMLKIAGEKALKKKSNVEFINSDILNIDKITNRKFDFIFSSTTLHYINNLKPVFSKIFNLLKDNGECIISVMNPIYTAQYPVYKHGRFPADEDWFVNYLDKSIRAYVQPWIEYNEGIIDFLSKSYHHTFSDYINAITEAGLKIKKIKEPYPPEKWKDRFKQRYKAYIETPSYLIILLNR